MKKLFTVLFLLFAFLASQASILAQGNSVADEVEQKREEIRLRVEERKQERQARVASKSAQIRQRLSDVKLRVCQNRQEVIKRRSLNLADRGKRHFDTFTSFYTRVDNYYTTKLVPEGIVLDNYDELKADIELQKDELEAAVAAAKAVAADFSCESDNPKGQLQDYRQEMLLVIEALKDYRESIKNFIKAVKEVVRENNIATSSADN